MKTRAESITDMKTQMERYFDRLWPICRSITGNGLRESFKILSELVPLDLTEVPSGTQVYDWEVPAEWNIKDAYILTPEGKKICDFKKNNLHVVNYSEPVNTELSFEELKDHLYYREDLPEAIPYVTSYYRRHWGFCISYNDYKNLSSSGKYKVVIDSGLEQGSLTYGDLVLKGKHEEEIIFSSYLCHPSMANNELSGPLALAFLYQEISKLPQRKYTYRFILAPETIGIIAYLAKYGMHMKENVIAGYVLTCCGDNGHLTYKRSRRGNSIADKAAEHILLYSGNKCAIVDFAIGGSDERQYCSPGFDLPVGSLMRTPYQRYKEYHTSLDNKELISFSALQQTVETYLEIVCAIELNETYSNLNPFCEPQLGKRGLYPTTGGTWGTSADFARMALHVLAFSDGVTDLIDIATRYNKKITEFEPVVNALREKNLLGVTNKKK